jgi:hypothetical protein
MVAKPSRATRRRPSQRPAETSPSAIWDRRISVHFTAPIAFAGNLFLAALVTQFGAAGASPEETALLTVFAVAVSFWSTFPGATAAGAITWLFYLGFVAGEGGDLALRGWTPIVSLVGFLCMALIAASLGETVSRGHDGPGEDQHGGQPAP